MLDLNTDAGRDALGALAARADIVVENFAPGVWSGLASAPTSSSAIKPGLPLVSILELRPERPVPRLQGKRTGLYGFAGEMYTMGLPSASP